MKKKIIIVSTKSITQDLFLNKLIKFLQSKDHKIITICKDPENLNSNVFKKIQILFPEKLSEFLNIKNIIIQVYKIIKINRDFNKPIFLLNTPLASHFIRFSLFFSKVNIVYFVHGYRFHPKSKIAKKFIFKFFEYLFSLKTDKYININKHDYNFTKYNLKKRNILVNGVGLEFQKKNYFNKNNFNKKRVIGVLAAYKKEKGYVDLINLAEKFEKNKDEIKIKAFGLGNRDPFLSIIKKKKLTNIILNTFNKKIVNEIKKFHILLHLSYREGLPVSVMQALLFGKPVVARKIRGNEDLIKNNFNGILFNDIAKDKIYIKIKKLILNKNFYIKMSKNAKRSIDKTYHHDFINRKFYRFINNV